MKSIKKYILILVCLIFVCACSAASDDGLSDGEYYINVDMTGGSGKASIESPAKLTVKDGSAIAGIIFSSPHYDYMIVEDEKYLPVNEDGNSEFEIPVVCFDEPFTVIADTTAMSKPHEIEYELTFHKDSISDEKSDSTAYRSDEKSEDDNEDSTFDIPPEVEGHEYIGETERKYATGFRIFNYDNNYRIIRIKGQDDLYLDDERVDNIYLAATAAMSLFDAADVIDCIKFSSLKEDAWTIEAARDRMADGQIIYAGKYSKPDYELLLDGGCKLAIESTMILHSPDVEEKLKDLGIRVLIDKSSYEENPLGRLEWIKVYGCICGNENKAIDFFEDSCLSYDELSRKLEDSKKGDTTIAFFYINNSGQVVTRKSDDYIVKLMETAGATFVPDIKGTGAVEISIEEFYLSAKAADILIYNGSIEKSPDSLDALCEKNEMLTEFKAVKEGKVYTTDSSLYQATDKTVEIAYDLYNMTENTDGLTFFAKIE